ncbi:phage/plasmid primase, P4 family [Lysinibacillus sphaericus]|uniref:DNA primase n=1 Tax=Lysinibacillus sphaericus OT4b.31 TaxID=1285586 RepID=R7ZIT8_LYSSH|nr:phage/plasmid primase, P4 family [Lysinibacillus sphaericus]EON73954.1 DNA primase [Lysinibacillus sphaericus OT4b.31]
MAIKEKEQILLVEEEYIPQELKQRRQFVLWKAVLNKETQNFDKLPFQSNGSPADSTDLATWGDFQTIMQVYNEGDYKGGQYDGIGFVLSDADKYACIDIDGLENTDNLDALASEITSMSYAEISPSGKGIHVWVEYKHDKTKHKNKDAKSGYEIYDQKRYITITGQALNNLPINKGGPQLDSFLDKVLKREKPANPQINKGQTGKATLPEGEIIKHALASKKSERFMKFMFGGWEQSYSSQSEADMAFANDLVFWCNCDFQMCDSIFRKSSLMREKYDRPRNGVTYGIELLNKAIEECENTFTLEEKPQKQFEWFSKNANNTTTFLHHLLGKKVIGEYSIVRYPNIHGDLYYYHKKRGIYEPDPSGRAIKGVIRHYDETLKNNQINEVLRYIEETCSIVKEVNSDYIVVGNGLINFKEKTLEPFTPKYFVLQKVATNYNPAAYNEFIENTLTKVTENHLPSIENIKEMFACILYPGILVPKLWYLYGKSASNGKSSLINMIYQTFDSEGGNISAISPHKLSTNNFSSAAIYGKLSNIVDDNPDFQIEDSGDLKTIITGGLVQIERKGKDSTTVRITTTMIVASNHLPRFAEQGNAINRRLWILPFNHNFSKDADCLSDIETQREISSQSAREYVLKLAIDTLFKLLNNNNPDKLTPNEKCQEILDAFVEQNDPWLDYFANFSISYFEENTGENVIKDYQVWCKDNMLTPLTNSRFKELVSTRLNMEWKDKRVTINGVSKVKKGFKLKAQQESQQKETFFKLANP